MTREQHIQALGLFGSVVRVAYRLGEVPGLVICILLFGVAPTLVVISAGMAVAEFRGPASSGLLYSWAVECSIGCLALMVAGIWAARSRRLLAAVLGAVVYALAGLGLVAIEAYTGASSVLGWWPKNEQGNLVMGFWWALWTSSYGLLIVVGCASVPFAFAMALEGRRAPSGFSRAIAGGPAGERRGDDPPKRRILAERPQLNFDDLAGMEPLKGQLREFAARFNRYHSTDAGVADTNGLLLIGPPGNGKSVFAEALAGELRFGFIKLAVQDLTSKWINESPGVIQEAFHEAVRAQPCVLFLDEIDSVGMKRASNGQPSHGEDVKVVDTLLTEIDKLRKHRVVLIAATNFPDDLDVALVRPGRFDRKIEVPLPDLSARVGILRALLDKHGVRVRDRCVLAVAELWERRSVAFIENVAKRVRDDLARSGRSEADAVMLKAAARAVSRREGAIPKTGSKLSDLVLPPGVRRDANSIVYRLRNWESLAARGGTPPKGVRLVGPPGTGKTLLVRAIARELGDWHVFEVRTANILADPRRFQEVLDLATEHRPAFIFIDEADDLLKDRSYSANATATNEVLKAMDGMMGTVPEVVFFAATNHPEDIDAAAKRGGRFAEELVLDLLRAADLREFVAAELARRRAVRFAPDLVPAWVEAAVVEISPADLVAVLDRAINATLVDDSPRAVGRAEFHEAYTAVTGSVARGP